MIPNLDTAQRTKVLIVLRAAQKIVTEQWHEPVFYVNAMGAPTFYTAFDKDGSGHRPNETPIIPYSADTPGVVSMALGPAIDKACKSPGAYLGTSSIPRSGDVKGWVLDCLPGDGPGKSLSVLKMVRGETEVDYSVVDQASALHAIATLIAHFERVEKESTTAVPTPAPAGEKTLPELIALSPQPVQDHIRMLEAQLAAVLPHPSQPASPASASSEGEGPMGM